MSKIMILLVLTTFCFSSDIPDWVLKFGLSSEFSDKTYFTGFGSSALIQNEKATNNDRFLASKKIARENLVNAVFRVGFSNFKVYSENIITKKSFNETIALINDSLSIVSKTDFDIEGIQYEVFNDDTNNCVYVLATLNKNSATLFYRNKLDYHVRKLQQIYEQIKTVLNNNDETDMQLSFLDCEQKCAKIDEIVLILSSINERLVSINEVSIYLSIKKFLLLYKLRINQTQYDVYFGGHERLTSAKTHFKLIRNIIPNGLLSQLFITFYDNSFACFLDLNTSHNTAENILNECKENFKNVYHYDDNYSDISKNLKTNNLNDNEEFRVIDTNDIQDTLKFKFKQYFNETKYIKIPSKLFVLLITLSPLDFEKSNLNYDKKKDVIRNVLQWDEYVEFASKKYSVNKTLIQSIIAQESCGKFNAVSVKGAKGLMQLMDGTAKELGVINSFDPFQNILGGTKYLRFLLDKFGDETLAIASYNAGFEKVILFNGIPPYRETQNYIQKVSNYKKVFMQKL